MVSARLVPSATILEQWLEAMESAIAKSGWSSFLAGRELQGDIANILSHARAARRDMGSRPLVDLRAELETAVEDVRAMATDMRDLSGVLRAELNGGRSRLTDCLALAAEPRVDSVAMALALKQLDALLERVNAIQAFPQELDALLKGAADVPKRH